MTYEGRTILNYKLTKKLGEGGFGAVYLGEHADLGRKAAIKILHHQFSTQPQMVERFFQEARAVCAINHRAIIAIENFGRLETSEPFYLMEFFPGGSLTDVASERWLNSEQLVTIFDPIVDALEAAHAKGIIHRDLKPDNVMVRIANDKVVDVRLLDFGIAKLLDGQSHSMTGSSMGTPAYMPPEQALDAKNVDVRADVYSFGATVYSAVAGRPPFDGSSVAAILLMVQTDTAPLIPSIRPDVPPELDAAIRRCLAKQRDHRPASIADAWRMIRTEIVHAHLSAKPIPPNPAHEGVQTPAPIEAGTREPPPPFVEPVEAATKPARRAAPVEAATKPGRPQVAAEPPATSPEVREKSKLPLILGGIGAVAVIGIVIAVASSGSSKTEGTGSGSALVVAPPDAAELAAPPPDTSEVTVLPVLVAADVIEPFTSAAKEKVASCGGKPSATTAPILYRVGVRADGMLEKLAIEGTSSTVAECVRKELESQHVGIKASKSGGSFMVALDMPVDSKKSPKPPGPGSNPKPPDPKPPDPKPPVLTCGEANLTAAVNAATSEEVPGVLKRLEGCRPLLDAGTFQRLQQLLVKKAI